ncbi:MAG: tetratricopeptide repeat protein [Gemmataceae bacterium]
MAIRKAELPEDHPEVILNELDLGRMYWSLGDFISALDSFRGVIAKQRRIGASRQPYLRAGFTKLSHLHSSTPNWPTKCSAK